LGGLKAKGGLSLAGGGGNGVGDTMALKPAKTFKPLEVESGGKAGGARRALGDLSNRASGPQQLGPDKPMKKAAAAPKTTTEALVKSMPGLGKCSEPEMEIMGQREMLPDFIDLEMEATLNACFAQAKRSKASRAHATKTPPPALLVDSFELPPRPYEDGALCVCVCVLWTVVGFFGVGSFVGFFLCVLFFVTYMHKRESQWAKLKKLTKYLVQADGLGDFLLSELPQMDAFDIRDF
jgi:hypothetical protein